MNPNDLGVLHVGLVTSVGTNAPATCAAVRSKLANPSLTSFVDSRGEFMMGHQVFLERPWRGVSKLAKMAAIAIDEAASPVPPPDRAGVPMIFCIAERERSGRIDSLEEDFALATANELGLALHPESRVISEGSVGVALALINAAELINSREFKHVIIAASDSLLTWPVLQSLEQQGRLLTETNSNGFMPGEGAGALLIGRPQPALGTKVRGIGLAREPAHIGAGLPLRADGMAAAIKAASQVSGIPASDITYRVSDVSGEQYYFKEASLALTRTTRYTTDLPDIWHPAESIGDTGAVAAIVCLAMVHAANQKGYAPGSTALLHFGNDSGRRAALITVAG